MGREGRATSCEGPIGHINVLVGAHLVRVVSLVSDGLTQKERLFQKALVTPVPVDTTTGAPRDRCAPRRRREIRQLRGFALPLEGVVYSRRGLWAEERRLCRRC